MDRKREAHMIPGAAVPGGQYSHVVTANGFAYVSGQVPVDPATKIMPADFAGQVRQTLRNVESILRGVGLTLADVVKVNAYLSDVTRFAEYNAIYTEFFPEAPPARTTVGCQLIGMLVEIDCVAAFPPA